MLWILLGLVIFNQLVYKSSLNPIFLQSLIWLVYYVFLSINIDLYDVNLQETHSFILLQAIGFSVGGLLAALFTNSKNILFKESIPDEKHVLTYRNVNDIFPVIAAVLVISTSFLIRQSGTISVYGVAQLREDFIQDDGKQYGLFGLIQFIISIYFVLFFATRRPFTLRYKLLFALFFYFTLLLGSKAQFLFLFCSVVYVLAWQKRINVYLIGLSSVILVLLMILITYLRYGDSDEQTLLTILSIYTITSMPALALVSHPVSPVFGYHTFRVIYLWLNKVGFSFPIAPTLSEFIATPLPTNTFSYVKPYFLDFGYVGVFLIPLIIGMFNNIAYFKARKGGLGSLTITALLMYPMLMQIFDEQYLRSITLWLYYIIFILALTRLNISFKKPVSVLKVEVK